MQGEKKRLLIKTSFWVMDVHCSGRRKSMPELVIKLRVAIMSSAAGSLFGVVVNGYL